MLLGVLTTEWCWPHDWHLQSQITWACESPCRRPPCIHSQRVPQSRIFSGRLSGRHWRRVISVRLLSEIFSELALNSMQNAGRVGAQHRGRCCTAELRVR